MGQCRFGKGLCMVLHFTFCLPQHWQVTYSVRKSHGKASRRYVWWGAKRILELHIKVYQHCGSPCVDLCGEGGAEHVDAELEVRLDAQHGQVVVADRLPRHRPHQPRPQLRQLGPQPRPVQHRQQRHYWYPLLEYVTNFLLLLSIDPFVLIFV